MLTFSFPCCTEDVGCCYSALNKFCRPFLWCKSLHGRAGEKWPQWCCPVVADRRLSAVVPAEHRAGLCLSPDSTPAPLAGPGLGWPWSITHQPHCFRGQDSMGGCPTQIFNLYKVRGPEWSQISILRGLRARSLCPWLAFAFAQGTNPFPFRWNRVLQYHHPNTCRRQCTRPGLSWYSSQVHGVTSLENKSRAESQASPPQQLGGVWIQEALSWSQLKRIKMNASPWRETEGTPGEHLAAVRGWGWGV